MGENNDEKRPGFDYWVTHNGQGKYYDTEWNRNGKRETLKGYYSHSVTDLALDSREPRTKPFCLCVGHKAPHGSGFRSRNTSTLYDNVR